MLKNAGPPPAQHTCDREPAGEITRPPGGLVLQFHPSCVSLRPLGKPEEDAEKALNHRALIRLAASLVIEQNDEWLVGRRYLSAHSLEAVLDEEKEQEEVRELTAV